MELDAELIEEFVLETRETIDEVEATLILIERERREDGSSDPEVVNRLFRAFHSVKGTAGFLGMDRLVTVTHAGENLLDRARSGLLELGSPQVDALCDALDFCREAVELMEGGKNDESLDPRRVLGAIQAAVAGEPEPVAEPPAPVASEPEPPIAQEEEPVEPPEPREEPEVPEPEAVAVDPEPPEADPEVPEVEEDGDPDDPHAAVAIVQATAPEATGQPPKRAARSRQSKSIRVDVDKLEALLNMVGELILAETSVTHHEEATRLQENDSFRRSVLQLNRVTRSLQDIAMSLRMVPVEASFNRLQRLVRDLAKKQEKDVALKLTGTDTEVDKNLIEAIGDPLVHIIRNAVDHGLESPSDRLENGKPATGTVHVDARHQAGEVWITIEDDGRGMDADAILAAAIRKGVVEPDVELSQQEIFSLVFEPGFSTAAKVTDVSGRGVGMDVVKRNIQALNGRIDIESELGSGTRVRLRVPLTLAIIEGMLVRVGGMRYTLPLLAIRESVPVANGRVKLLPNGRRIARIRGGILPVYSLDGFVDSSGGEASDGEDSILIALEHGGRTFAVEVDELLGQRQTVVKGLPPYLARQPGLAGCSILPNGEITLILDLADIAARADHVEAA